MYASRRSGMIMVVWACVLAVVHVLGNHNVVACHGCKLCVYFASNDEIVPLVHILWLRAVACAVAGHGCGP
jgi:hypothetical protein